MKLTFIIALLTTLVGQVYDRQTGEPLPNISVYIAGTQVGVATNDEGYFLLRTDLDKRARVVVSGIGYRKEQVTLEPGQSAGIDFALQEKTTQLQDVFITPDVNPAMELMKRIRQARALNDLPPSLSPDYDTHLYLSNIEAKHLKRHIWQSLQSGMIQQSDSSYLLPLYHKTMQQGQANAQAVMLTETDYDILLSDLDNPIDFYKNQIPIYNTSFLSPLAADGNTFYAYYLADSAQTDFGKTYTVHFRTRNPYYNTFNGEMLIDSASAALLRIEASAPRQVNANYLHQLTISQTFDSLSHTLLSEQQTLLLDVAIKADTSHIFPTAFIQHHKTYSPCIVHNQPSTDTVHCALPTVNRLSPDSAMQVLQDLPLIRTATWIAYIIQNASIPTGTILEIGKLTNLIHVSPQEGVRVGIPLRTSPKLWKNVCLEAYAACGWRDKAWKGRGTVYWNMPTQRRNLLRVQYVDDYTYSDVSDFDLLLRENITWNQSMSMAMVLTKNFYNGTHTYNTMVRQREGQIRLDSDWSDQVETQLQLCVGTMGYGEPTTNYFAQPSFFYSKLSGIVRLSWQEKKVDLFCHRVHIYNHLPVLYLGGEIGSYRLPDRDQYDTYGKLSLRLRHTQPLGAGGQLSYLFEAGLILGTVPYPLLNIFDGNQSYGYDPGRFSLMHSYQFAADRYLTLHADWNGQGCLFNLIPGLRVLRLRELASFKLAYGGLSPRHAERLTFPDEYLQNLQVPYVEVGVGIGNILRIADLMSVWRLTHRSDPGAPTWSMRFRFHLDT
ncbi:MAG: DUF5686 and carboxypeptidase regulatory-like domain-containing protein [Paludibacteraceae bacterium]|nr:DUF5686 and carboxypeptidase regulatory-like domain-containing protein [Paludibacteraceae bacterium]